MVHRAIPHVFILLIFLCGAQVAWGETSTHSSFSTSEFDRPIHFLAVDGSDVLIPPGNYQVEAAEEWLRLVPSNQDRADAWLIEAHASTHEEPLASPMAVSVQDEASPDIHHLVLLFPDGTSLEAVGSVSGIRSRGMTRLLSRAKLNTAVVARRQRASAPPARVRDPQQSSSPLSSTSQAAVDSPLQIYLDRLEVISDGDRVGAGEINIGFLVLHSRPSCPKWYDSAYTECGSWGYAKRHKAKSGDVKDLKYTLPAPRDPEKYVAVQSIDTVYLFLKIRERDPEIVDHSSPPHRPFRALTQANGWGIGSHTEVVDDGRAGKRRLEVKLHFRVTPWQPDLKLEDFWTVPRVPNPGYETTRVCVKVSNIGNVPSSSFTPNIYMDNTQPYYRLPRQEGLPPRSKPGNRQTTCGMMPTPAEGKHRIGAYLILEEFDSNTGNHFPPLKDLVSKKRMTQEEAWQRVWGQVRAFGDQVRQLKAALGLNGAALPRPPKGIRPVSWHSSSAPPWFNESGMFFNSPEKMLRVAGPSRFDKRKGFKKSPPRRARQNQQEVLQLVSNIRNRAVNIQSEAQMLRGAYLDLQKEAAAKKTAELMGVAKQLYQRCLKLSETIRDSNVPEIEIGVSILNDGYQNMTKRLKLLRKF